MAILIRGGHRLAALPVLRFIRKEIAKHVSCKLCALRANKISLWIFYLEFGMIRFDLESLLKPIALHAIIRWRITRVDGGKKDGNG